MKQEPPLDMALKWNINNQDLFLKQVVLYCCCQFDLLF